MNKAFFNAEKLCSDVSRLGRVQLMHIRDCALSLTEKPLSLTENEFELSAVNDDFVQEYRKISDSLNPKHNIDEHEAPETNRFVPASNASFGSLCRALLCRYIWSLTLGTDRELSAEMFLRQEKSAPDLRIAYVKNSYSDEAYRTFSSVLKGATVVYPGSFSTVCEEVYNNQAGFCILPYETSDDGALSGFCRLIARYELVQVMSCSVASETPNGTRITRFALLSKGFCPSIIPKNDSRFLKIIVDSPEALLLSDIYRAAELNGLKFVKSESIPVEWDSERYSSAVTFALGSYDPTPFLLYLALEVPQSTADSIYCTF